MALSDEERQRIREEELVRLQAREEFRSTVAPKNHARLLAIALVFIAALLILWNVLNSSKATRLRPAESPAAGLRSGIHATAGDTALEARLNDLIEQLNRSLRQR